MLAIGGLANMGVRGGGPHIEYLLFIGQRSESKTTLQSTRYLR